MKRVKNPKAGPRTQMPLTRSELMARIKSRGNKSTELRLVRLFRANGIRGWRRGSSMYGKPDFVFSKKHLVIFVDGCFWHGHPRRCRLPAKNRGYWSGKIEANKKRDANVNRQLKKAGWRVIRIWEHRLTGARVQPLIDSIFRTLEAL